MLVFDCFTNWFDLFWQTDRAINHGEITKNTKRARVFVLACDTRFDKLSSHMKFL